MKAPNYQVDLIRDVRPSTADVSGLAQATANEMATAGAARAGLVKTLGGTIWEAYKGKEMADFEKQLEAERQGFVQPLKEAGKGLLAAEEKKKQGLIFAADAAQKLLDESLASDMEGRDPALVEQQAVGMFTKAKSSVLNEYEQKLKSYNEVLSNFPARQDEMMARSEALLKQYIARMPGMADQFRKASQRILGVQGIESFTTMQAYRAVENFSRQQAAAAQETARMAAKEQEEALGAFKKSYVAMGGDEFGALEAWNNPELRNIALGQMRLFSENQKEIARKKQSFEAGEIALSDYVTTGLASAEVAMAAALPVLYSDLRKAGLDDATIKSGALSTEQLRNPAIKASIQRYVGMATAEIDRVADGLIADLGGQRARGELKIKQDEYNKSVESINKWRETTKANRVGDKGQGLFAALGDLAQADVKAIQTMQTSTYVFKNFLGILDPTGQLQQQISTADPVRMKQILKTYPNAALVSEVLQAMNKVTRPDEVLRFAEDFSKKIGQGHNFQDTARPQNKAANPESVAMNTVDFAAMQKVIKETAADPQAAIGDNVMRAVKVVINGASSDAEYGSSFFKQGVSELQDVIKRASPAQKEIIKQQVLDAYNSSIYGFQSHGEALSRYLGELKKSKPAAVSFVDTSGASGLKYKAQPEMRTRDTKEQIPAQMSEATREMAYNYHAVLTNEKKINAVLSHVDNALRVRAQLNEESLIKLRQDFIKQVNEAYQKNIPISEVIARTMQTTQSATPSAAPASSSASSAAATNDAASILEGLRKLGN